MKKALLGCALFASSTLSLAQTPIEHLTAPLTIDGYIDQAVENKEWKPLFFVMDGTKPSEDDFSGSYHLGWREEALYLSVKFKDDVLIDKIGSPLERYWDDDALEIFVDEDASGGKHQFDFNAFAYHIALDGQAIDIGPSKDDRTNFIALNDHVVSAWKRQNDGSVVWEVKLSIYDDRFSLEGTHQPVKLTPGKELGFMLAYCDNDGADVREHFLGSHAYQPQNGSLNLGFITADVFEKMVLVKE